MERSLDDWAAELREAQAAENATAAALEEARKTHERAGVRVKWLGQSIMRVASGRDPVPEPVLAPWE